MKRWFGDFAAFIFFLAAPSFAQQDKIVQGLAAATPAQVQDMLKKWASWKSMSTSDVVMNWNLPGDVKIGDLEIVAGTPVKVQFSSVETRGEGEVEGHVFSVLSEKEVFGLFRSVPDGVGRFFLKTSDSTIAVGTAMKAEPAFDQNLKLESVAIELQGDGGIFIRRVFFRSPEKNKPPLQDKGTLL